MYLKLAGCQKALSFVAMAFKEEQASSHPQTHVLTELRSKDLYHFSF